jgi:hypothetical protein
MSRNLQQAEYTWLDEIPYEQRKQAAAMPATLESLPQVIFSLGKTLA